jgi:Fe-S cluster biogenesis protein NfuA
MDRSPTDLEFEQVREVIDRLRPFVQEHGGDIQLIAVEGSNAHVRLIGRCVGCPSSAVTLKSGIEERLREEIPGFGEVVATDR